MPRPPRMLVSDEPAVYHVMSRTALDGFPLDAREKDAFIKICRHFTSIYFAQVLGLCVMDNHFHLLLRMLPGEAISEQDLVRRFQKAFGPQAKATPGQLAEARAKWSSLSLLMRDIKQSFSRGYNQRHGRQGYFWGDRFRSVLVEDGASLLNCLAYIDLNPVRAGLVRRPEDYAWSSMGLHAQKGNPEGWLSCDYGLGEWEIADRAERFRLYREFVYRTGAEPSAKGASLDGELLERAEKEGFRAESPAIVPDVVPAALAQRSRVLTRSAMLGSQAFIERMAAKLGLARRKPKPLPGLDGAFAFLGRARKR